MGSESKMALFREKQSALQQQKSNDNPAKQRINNLLDADSFVEIDSLMQTDSPNLGFEREKKAGDGVITGYGTINQRAVYVAAQDPTVYGGSIGRSHALKISKAILEAARCGVPFIGLYDSGGARIDEGILALEAAGDILNCLHDVAGEIPLIAGICGPCAGGMALVAEQSDFVIMSEAGGGIFMNGPMVLAAVENKNIDAAAIGGAKIHASKTGMATFSVDTDQALCAKIREIFEFVPDTADGFSVKVTAQDDPNRAEIELDAIAEQLDQSYPIEKILQDVLDQNSILYTSEAYEPGMLTGLAKLDGRVVGFIATKEERLTVEACDKAIKTIQYCDRFNIPLITFVNAIGSELSIESEHQGIVRAYAYMLNAMIASTMPKVAIIIGKAIGISYVVLASKSCGMDRVYAWPTAEIAVVESDTAAHIVYRKEIAAAADPVKARQTYADIYATELANATIAGYHGCVDEIIYPCATRARLISAMDMIEQ